MRNDLRTRYAVAELQTSHVHPVRVPRRLGCIQRPRRCARQASFFFKSTNAWLFSFSCFQRPVDAPDRHFFLVINDRVVFFSFSCIQRTRVSSPQASACFCLLTALHCVCVPLELLSISFFTDFFSGICLLYSLTHTHTHRHLLALLTHTHTHTHTHTQASACATPLCRVDASLWSCSQFQKWCPCGGWGDPFGGARGRGDEERR